jgi:hypothetical protein
VLMRAGAEGQAHRLSDLIWVEPEGSPSAAS